MTNWISKLFKRKPDNSYEHVIRLNGFSACLHTKSKGQYVTVYGWCNDHFKYKHGQRVLVVTKEGQAARYKITRVVHHPDPSDMYFLDCVFDPRIDQT